MEWAVRWAAETKRQRVKKCANWERRRLNWQMNEVLFYPHGEERDGGKRGRPQVEEDWWGKKRTGDTKGCQEICWVSHVPWRSASDHLDCSATMPIPPCSMQQTTSSTLLPDWLYHRLVIVFSLLRLPRCIMKLFLPALFGLLPFALAGDSQKSVVVTYPQDTPNSVLTTAKNAIIDAVCFTWFWK